MQYRIILKNAWHNTWHHKYLWFFGLFATFLGGVNETLFVFQTFDSNVEKGLFSGLRNIASTGVFTKQWLVNFGKLIADQPFVVTAFITVILIIIILTLFIIWLAMVSQIAIVNNTALAGTEKKHDFKTALDAGIKNFWPIFGINVIYKIAVYILILLISLPVVLIGLKAVVVGNVLFFVLFLFLIPLAISLSFIIKYAIASIIIRKNNWMEAMKFGYELFIKNWLVSLEVALILFSISFLVSFCLLLSLMVIAAPFLFIFSIFTGLLVHFGFLFFVLIASSLYLISAAFVGSALTVFEISVWTILFTELVGNGGVSKIVRVFSKK